MGMLIGVISVYVSTLNPRSLTNSIAIINPTNTRLNIPYNVIHIVSESAVFTIKKDTNIIIPKQRLSHDLDRQLA